MAKPYWLVFALIFVVANTSAEGVDMHVSDRSCHSDPKLIGPCFTVRGRMNYWNGAPSVRIWRVGTNRILGVTGYRNTDGYSTIPDELLDKVSWDSDLFADFVVCPFTPERPGVMQFICVDSATNISVRDQHP